MTDTPQRRTSDGNGNGNGELPWRAILRVPLTQLVVLVTLISAITRIYDTQQIQAAQIAAAQTKEAAQAEMKVIIQRLDDLKEQVNRIEQNQSGDTQQQRDDPPRRSRRGINSP